MFPPVEVLFISVFLTILAALATVAIVSFVRARRDLSTGRAEPIRWALDFGELPASFRQCRHALTGEAPGRICPNAFDCRSCANHPEFRRIEAGEGPDM